MTADSADGGIDRSPSAVFTVNRGERDINVRNRTFEIICGIREVDHSVADADLINVPGPIVRRLLFVFWKGCFFLSFLRVLFSLGLLFLNDMRQQLDQIQAVFVSDNNN